MKKEQRMIVRRLSRQIKNEKSPKKKEILKIRRSEFRG